MERLHPMMKYGNFIEVHVYNNPQYTSHVSGVNVLAIIHNKLKSLTIIQITWSTLFCMIYVHVYMLIDHDDPLKHCSEKRSETCLCNSQLSYV